MKTRRNFVPGDLVCVNTYAPFYSDKFEVNRDVPYWGKKIKYSSNRELVLLLEAEFNDFEEYRNEERNRWKVLMLSSQRCYHVVEFDIVEKIA